MKDNGADQRTLAICFGQFGPYHHARVAALQHVGREHGAGGMEHGVKVIPVQIAGATTTYAWKSEQGAGPPARRPYGSERSRERGDGPGGVVSPPRAEPSEVVSPSRAEGLRTLCEGVEEAASPVEVFLKARRLFREEKVEVAFLPSYSPVRYFALFAAAKYLGIRTVMMNESHAGTEQATGWKRWIKQQIVKRFDAALVGGEPHRRHFASLGIPADKIFTGYDAVDNALFAAKADEVRSMEQGAWSVEQDRKADEIRAAAKKSVQCSVFSVQQEEKADEVRKPSSPRARSGEQEVKADEVRRKSDEWREPESEEMALRQTSDELGEAEGKAAEVRTLSSQRSQSRGSKEQDRPEAEDGIGGKKNLL